MTPVKRPKPRRPRKPDTVLRYARNTVNIARSWNHLDRGTGNHWVEVNQTLLRTLSLLRELRRSLSQESRRG